MCFSATASFVAGTALVATGAVTTAKVKKIKELPFRSIPLLFGIQQLLDGIAWVSIGSPVLNAFAAYGYAFFAFVLWPIFVPVSVLCMETNAERKKILQGLVVFGVGVGLCAIYLILSGPVTALVVHSCIRYDTFSPYPLWLLGFYVVVTCGSFFVSNHRFVNLFGVVVFISFLIAGWFYIETFSSVWCFFAALLSLMIYSRFQH